MINFLGNVIHIVKLTTGMFEFLIQALKNTSIEYLQLEVQILRLICGFLWLVTTISISVSNLTPQTKILVIALGLLTLLDILLRTYKLKEVKQK